MSRELFGLEVGIHIFSQDENTGVAILHGSPVPGGETFTDAAEQGSFYLRTNGEQWQKYLSGTGTDKWRRLATTQDILDLSWRSDKVRVLTSTVAPIEGGTIDLGSVQFDDDDTPFLTGADFTLGDAILFGQGGTEVIARITDITGDVLTFTISPTHATYPVDPLADNDVFIVRYYLPDSPDAQEKQAIVLYNGTDYVKVGDFNWDLATGINISAGYTPGCGNITTSDTVESAIEKLDGHGDVTDTFLGKASQCATDYGVVFTGDIIRDNANVQEALQDLETAIEGYQANVNGITTETTIDEVLVDNIIAIEWYVAIMLSSDHSRRNTYKVNAQHDGTLTADAVNVDDSIHARLTSGAGFASAIVVDLNGTGATQTMRLRVSSVSPGVDVKAVRDTWINY